MVVRRCCGPYYCKRDIACDEEMNAIFAPDATRNEELIQIQNLKGGEHYFRSLHMLNVLGASLSKPHING